LTLVIPVSSATAADPPALASTAPSQPSSDIAYVYHGNTADATSFYNLLTGSGYGVDLIPLANVLTTSFKPYKMIIIADDTGSLND
jgi:hypothetical protein